MGKLKESMDKRQTGSGDIEYTDIDKSDLDVGRYMFSLSCMDSALLQKPAPVLYRNGRKSGTLSVHDSSK